MRTSLLLAPFLPLLANAAAAAADGPTTTVTLHVPASQALPNPRALPPSTHATLTTRGAAPAAAYLTPSGAFLFRNVSEGSYLLDVHCGTHAFAPLRVDVYARSLAAAAAAEGAGPAPAGLGVRAWETYRGNDWDNKGEAAGGAAGRLEVRALGAKAYFVERSSFNVLSILKNPMILLGLASMAIFVGMPYLVDNMDPEMRKEWEESQKSNPMNSIMGGGQSGGAGNFDMAAFLAGSSSRDNNNNNNNGGGAASGGSKKEKGGRK